MNNENTQKIELIYSMIDIKVEIDNSYYSRGEPFHDIPSFDDHTNIIISGWIPESKSQYQNYEENKFNNGYVQESFEFNVNDVVFNKDLSIFLLQRDESLTTANMMLKCNSSFVRNKENVLEVLKLKSLPFLLILECLDVDVTLALLKISLKEEKNRIRNGKNKLYSLKFIANLDKNIYYDKKIIDFFKNEIEFMKEHYMGNQIINNIVKIAQEILDKEKRQENLEERLEKKDVGSLRKKI